MNKMKSIDLFVTYLLVIDLKKYFCLTLCMLNCHKEYLHFIPFHLFSETGFSYSVAKKERVCHDEMFIQ